MMARVNLKMRSLRHQKGTVLLTVMLMVAVAAFIATEIAYRQKMDVLRTAAFMARDSAFQYLIAAENIGIYALKTDLKDDENNFKKNPGFEIRDDLGENWNRKAIYPIPGVGMIEGHLVDLSGRFNINSLVNNDAKKAADYQKAFINLLNSVQQSNPKIFPDTVTPQMLEERVKDWLDGDTTPTDYDGKEDDDYLKKDHPYRTANHVITDLSELLLIDGFTPAILDALKDDLSCLPPDTRLNMFTANQDVLKAFGFDATAVAKFVSTQRPQDPNITSKTPPYKTKMDLFNYLKDPNGNPNAATNSGIVQVTGAGASTGEATTGSTKPNINPDLFDIKSDYYLLEGKAVVNGRPVLIESVIWRPRTPIAGSGSSGSGGATGSAGAAGTGASTSSSPPPPKVIIRKFVDPLKQV